jgi:hypothetical protein
MFKATSTNAPDNPQRQVAPNYFFDETFYNNIVYLDFAAKAPVTSEMSWGQYLSLEFEDFKNRLESSVDKFGLGFSPNDLDIVEQLINSRYAGMLNMRGSSISLGGTSAMMLSIEDGGSITFVSSKAKESFYRDMRAYHEVLIDLVDLINESLRATDQELIMVVQHWEQHVAPAVGSARFGIVQSLNDS